MTCHEILDTAMTRPEIGTGHFRCLLVLLLHSPIHVFMSDLSQFWQYASTAKYANNDKPVIASLVMDQSWSRFLVINSSSVEALKWQPESVTGVSSLRRKKRSRDRLLGKDLDLGSAPMAFTNGYAPRMANRMGISGGLARH